MSNWRKSVHATLVALVVMLTTTVPASAFEGRGGDTVTIDKGEVVNDDLYVGADTFVLDGTVNGDVIAAGTTLTINGSVNGNLVAAGQTIIVNGQVTGDALVAGAVLYFGDMAKIGGDVVGAGSSLEFRDGSEVGRDAVLAGGQIALGGHVARNVMAGTAALQLSGSVGGDVKAAVGEAGRPQVGPPFSDWMQDSPVTTPVIPQGLTIDPAATIAGNLEYTQNQELSLPAGVVAGTITRLPQPEDGADKPHELTQAEKINEWALGAMRTLATLLLLGLFLLWVLPGFLKGLREQVETRPWASLGFGVISYAGFFFLLLLIVFAAVLGALIFGLFTLAGLSVTIASLGILALLALILGFVLATTFLAKIVFGMSLGRWILLKAGSPLAQHRYWPMVIGVAITVLVIALFTHPLMPGFLGPLLDFAVVLFGLGALSLWILNSTRRSASAAMPAQT